jgi:uncharacterized phage protein gp47/JayE
VSKTPDQIAQQILATLAQTMPTLSCAIGTPERKIIDACAEQISTASIDTYLVGSLLDIDTKAGAELEQFVGIFGYGRLSGKPAQGTVRVTLTVASTSDYTISQGVTFYTGTGVSGLTTQLYYSANQSVVLPAGDYSVDVPVTCTTVGVAGNVPPGSITNLSSAIGSSAVTNLQAMTDGTDPESDDQLRQRFKDTFLRNVAGTADWYIALCQQNNAVTRVVVFGPTALYTTQIAAPSTTLALPVDQDVKYVWPDQTSCFINLGQPTETFYAENDDYVLSTGISPVFTTVSSGAISPGDIVDLEFQYTPVCSRNDPANGIANKVDVFCDGIAPFTVTERSVIDGTELSSESGDPFYTGNFMRLGSTGSPVATNRYTRLGNVPLVTFPPTLTVGGEIYTLGTHYFVIQDITLLQGSRLEATGIEWDSSGPATGAELTLEYVYNQVPEVLDNVMTTSKQLTTDVMVHQAQYVYLQPCLNIEYDRSYSPATVNAAVATRLQSYIAGLPFGSQIKFSVLCSVIGQVLGVVDVKVTSSTDNPDVYGIQVFANSEDIAPLSVQATDFKLDDNQVAYFLGSIITRTAAP